MEDKDFSIFEYRKEKEIQFFDYIFREKIQGSYDKRCIKTEVSGYVDCYIYKPNLESINAPLPIYINFHGGGNVLGFPELDGFYCQYLANYAECYVVNIDYCLAPEFKFPKPILSSYEVVKNIQENATKYHGDPQKIIIGGHSAGGNLACSLCLLNEERKELMIQGLIMDYPPLCHTLDNSKRQAIDATKAMKPSRVEQYIQWYFEDEKDMLNPLASPLLSSLNHLPKTLLIGAQYDSLLQEQKEFYNKAKSNGNDIEFVEFADCQHGFTHKCFNEYNEKAALKAWRLMGEFIKSTVSKK